MKTSEGFSLPNYLMGPHKDPICNKIRQRNGRNVTEVSFISPINEFYLIGMSACH